MKITLEPTRPGTSQHTVVLEHPEDELDIEGVMQLISEALMAYGYMPETVREMLDIE